MPNTQFISDDSSRGRLGDITVGDQSHISGACIDLLIERERPIGIDQNVAVVGCDAACRSKRHTVDRGGRQSADNQCVRIVEDDRATTEVVSDRERIHIIGIAQ